MHSMVTQTQLQIRTRNLETSVPKRPVEKTHAYSISWNTSVVRAMRGHRKEHEHMAGVLSWRHMDIFIFTCQYVHVLFCALRLVCAALVFQDDMSAL